MKVVVIGAGVAGLVAARELSRAGAEVVVLEGSDHIGGKLRLAEVAGVRVDVGAEAALARRPEAVDLIEALGLPLVHPTTATSRIWTRDALRPMPPSVMGAPTDLSALEASGILTDAALERVRAEADLPLTTGSDSDSDDDGDRDVAVGVLLEERFGAEVVDKLVDPLLGGVYAGRAREISVRAAVPQLAAMLSRGALTPQLSAIPRGTGGPVFAGIAGGMGTLPAALAAALDVRTRQPVVAAGPAAAGEAGRWWVATPTDRLLADAVVVAVPAWSAPELIGALTGGEALELRHVDHASVAVITHAFRIEDLPGAPLDGSLSGFLVPPIEGRRIKASTFSFAKWDWVREAGAAAGVVHLRTSIGRHRELHALDRTDTELIAASLGDLAEATGLRVAPVDTHVQRWVQGLPQYAVGHLDAMRAQQAAVAAVPGVVLCGAAYQGVGIPAVIASATAAAARVLADLG
ncbi:protoporphyrinogen oxidase [Nocardioides sp.]|uniref:protoporphyrinogen oxidase n=1 Tax=Nocardioides sp. TaxID=35761 RepID=UPI002626B700|nr:protoporphyrinogen oxidase [Nocardioides sp.]